MAATRPGKGTLRTALVAACGLLGINGTAAEATEVSTAVLGYTEPGRVSAMEAMVDLKHEFANGRSTNFRLVYDVLTGASANGAMPWTTTQTFTRPSGRGQYTAGPGIMPLDDTFRDARVAVSGGVGLPLDRLTTLSFGLYGSGEHDYVSLGANGSLARDFNRRNTTLALRFALFRDTINPEGGRPIPLAAMVPPEEVQPRQIGDGQKDVLDLGLGLTQTLDKATLVHLNYTFSQVQGYQTDPYKMLSQVDGMTGAPVAYLYESRPENRTKHVFYGRLIHNLSGDVVRLSYRFMTDDWGLDTHMVDMDYRWQVSGATYLQPHVRWYSQGPADFYRYFLTSGEPLPATASADYRLGDMQTWTMGLKYGRTLGNGHALTLRGEYYVQTGESQPEVAVGELRNFDLFPTVDAFIFQIGYSLGK